MGVDRVGPCGEGDGEAGDPVGASAAQAQVGPCGEGDGEAGDPDEAEGRVGGVAKSGRREAEWGGDFSSMRGRGMEAVLGESPRQGSPIETTQGAVKWVSFY
ncbi:MAG: hypothetical protein RL077_37 [Verrucomicrobiota bacterium]